MTATVLLPAAQAILNVLIPLVTQQINLAWGFKGDLIKLKRRLKNIQALLRDAERGQVESEALKEWLKSLKSATCDAENVLGEFAYEAFRRKLEVSCQTTSLFNGSSAILFQQDKPSVCIIYGTSGDDGRTAVVAAREIIPLKKKNFRRQYARFLEFTASFSTSAVVCSEGCQLESSFVKVACEDFGPGEYCIIADSGQSNLDLITDQGPSYRMYSIHYPQGFENQHGLLLITVGAVCIIYGTSGDSGRTAVVAACEIIPLKKKNFGMQYARHHSGPIISCCATRHISARAALQNAVAEPSKPSSKSTRKKANN
ncbi:hypothetical protein Vadar_028103 [Vaccinium darrowii]|uniref:Uncharacterized protein n=1 Tax=Vaccinium darrowii TaxID=229202 RepID=A0ACB7XTW7_9ERIC|nr:hypothetical protein Vadar_028103 [Vaccinium darrowii]